jgi:hypothetical protein
MYERAIDMRGPPTITTLYIFRQMSKRKDFMEKKSTLKELLALAAYLFHLAHHDTSELSEELLTNSTAVQVLEEGLTYYIQRVKSRIESQTAPETLEPKVTASCSIDEKELDAVNVTLWFAQGADEDLQSLHEDAYGEGSTTESMIQFLAFFDRDIEALLFTTDDPEVVCEVNEKEAKAWIAAHRPHIRLA